jgi:hypothetical protein
MIKKLLSIFIVLSLASLAFAGTITKSKKYDVTFKVPTMAGKVRLAPGAYKLQIIGDNATFTDANNKAFTVPVKIKTAKTKYDVTSVEASSKTGEDVIQAISFAGTTTQVEF